MPNSDEADSNSDGIPGKPNYIWDAVKQQTILGRFGWKAKNPSLFIQAQCSLCHSSMMKTKTNVSFPEISNQIIFPYTDMLLHEMGNELTDSHPIFLAAGRILQNQNVMH
ncbi:MAG: di-heme oxidoredictase family protein [Bacteroidia bacterium]